MSPRLAPLWTSSRWKPLLTLMYLLHIKEITSRANSKRQGVSRKPTDSLFFCNMRAFKDILCSPLPCPSHNQRVLRRCVRSAVETGHQGFESEVTRLSQKITSQLCVRIILMSGRDYLKALQRLMTQSSSFVFAARYSGRLVIAPSFRYPRFE